MPHEEVDLNAPFIAQDGLEYDHFAAYLCGQPADTWRNQRIQEHRKAGRSEEALRQWIKGYDGDDPRTTSQLEAAERVSRQVAANFAVCPHGLGLAPTPIKERQRRAWWAVDDFDEACKLAPSPSF